MLLLIASDHFFGGIGKLICSAGSAVLIWLQCQSEFRSYRVCSAAAVLVPEDNVQGVNDAGNKAETGEGDIDQQIDVATL